MGACEVCRTEYGKSFKEAYRKVVRDDREDYGNDAYNGSFTTCSLQRTFRIADVYKKGNEKKAWERIKDIDIDKRDAYGVDMGVCRYEVVKCRTEKRGTGKTEAKYCVESDADESGRFKAFGTLAEAKAYAERKSLEDGCSCYISKRYLTDGDDWLFHTKIETKEYRSRPKSIPKNAVLNEIHAYYFYGLAAE